MVGLWGKLVLHDGIQLLLIKDADSMRLELLKGCFVATLKAVADQGCWVNVVRVELGDEADFFWQGPCGRQPAQLQQDDGTLQCFTTILRNSQGSMSWHKGVIEVD